MYMRKYIPGISHLHVLAHHCYIPAISNPRPSIWGPHGPPPVEECPPPWVPCWWRVKTWPRNHGELLQKHGDITRNHADFFGYRINMALTMAI
jgi:hypothetical protein